MDFKRIIAGATMTVIAFAVCSVSSFAADKDDVVATVNRYLNNLDKPETPLAICDSHVSIIDEFPPHEWHGPTACTDWWKALNAYNKKNDITSGEAPLGTPWNVDVNGDRAYFVAPMTYSYKQHGKPVKESATFTVALKRTPTGWRITAWAYSKQ